MVINCAPAGDSGNRDPARFDLTAVEARQRFIQAPGGFVEPLLVHRVIQGQQALEQPGVAQDDEERAAFDRSGGALLAV